jgi:hypothetical protein
MLNTKQKNAIENLLIIADYIKEHSIYSGEMKTIIDKSIEHAEQLIGRQVNPKEENDSKDSVAKIILDKFNSDNP